MLSPARAAPRHAHLQRTLLYGDVLAGFLSGLCTGIVASADPSAGLLVAAVLAVAWPACAYACGLYVVNDLRAWASGVSQAPRFVLSCLLLSWPVYGLLVLVDAHAPALGALSAGALLALTSSAARTGGRMRAHRNVALRQRTLIVGSGEVANRVVERMLHHDKLGLDPIGFVDDGVHRSSVLGLPCKGGLAELPELILEWEIDRVVIAFTRAGHEKLLGCIRDCRDAGVPVDVVPRLFEFLDGARTLDHIGGLPLLTIDVPKFSRCSQISKRALDIVLASLGLLVMAPLLLALAIAVKLDSPGPVLFVQPRSGRGGRFFRLYKFRSMRVGSEVLVRPDGAILKAVDDARVTRVGRTLRRFSLDEAPQLLNVLKGDMSLVGPRPLVAAEEAALDETWHVRRADLRPGLTGPWQISGRSQLPFDEMIRFDYQYVAGWSLARDVEILLATVPVVLTGRGAY